MGNENSILKTFESQFATISNQLNGSTDSAGHALRKLAIESIRNTGLPTRKNEEYKYTPLSSELEKAFNGFSLDELKESPVNASLIPELKGNRIVFANGEYNSLLSDFSEQDGLTIEVITEVNQLIEKDVDKDLASDSFSNLNLALAGTGVVVSVAKGKVINEPIHIIHLNNTTDSRSVSTLRHRIDIEENAQATICEYFIGEGEHSCFINTVVESTLGLSARLNHYKIGLDGKEDLRIDNTTCHQQGKSTFTTHNVNFGGKVVRNNLNIILDGEYCETHLDGLYMPQEGGTIDNHTIVDHQLPNSNSNELYKGIMPDNSTGVFNGKVFVRADAQKTNAFQSNKNILLSDTATINTKPQLEIWADDVKCSHGCTTGQLDPEQLFYLRARGIDEVSARKLLLKAFAEEVVDKIQVDEVKEIAEAVLDKRLG